MQSNRTNIVLIGMPGAGKSTLGVLVAKALGLNFTDTDLLIQRAKGKRLQDIIDNDGIDAFLCDEAEILASLDVNDSVIATGGSAVYSDTAMKHLTEIGVIVFLDVPIDELAARLTNIADRGIALRPGKTISDIYTERLPLYRKYAEIAVNCSGSNPEKHVREITSLVRDKL